MKLLPAVLALLLGAAACGGEDPPGRDLAATCAAVAEAWPGNLYDDEANAAFAKELGRILQDAEPTVREQFEEVATHVDLVVAAAGDNTAVLTESVEVKAALQEVDKACAGADAPTIG